jgi:hypothetical protein
MDTLDITHQDRDRYALYAIRQTSGSLVIVGREKRGNKGAAAIYSLLQSKVMNLENSLRMNISEQVLSDGTGNSGKDFQGLAAVCNAGTTLAGLAPATYGAWRPGAAAAGSALTTRAGDHTDSTDFDGGTAPNTTGIVAMRAVYVNISHGLDQPDGVFMAPKEWREYDAALTPQVRYGDVDEANTGFRSLLFEGAGCFFDHDISGAIYILNSRHIAFMRDSDADFAWIDEGQVPTDQDIFVRNMIVEGNVVTDNRRLVGRLSTVT